MMEEQSSIEPTNCTSFGDVDDEEETGNSSPQLTVLTTVAYDYTDLPDPKPFDRMDIDNHNVEFDDSNQVSSTTESTVFQQPTEIVEPVPDEPEPAPEQNVEVENANPPPSPKEEPKSTSKRGKRSVSPNTTPGKSRYGRVRKQKLSADFVSVDRKSFAVLNSNSYEPTIPDSLAVPKLEKPKRAYRKKLKYVVENATENDTSIISKISVEENALVNDVEESSRTSLSVSTIKTYSKKCDVSLSMDEKSVDNDVVQVSYPELNWKVGDVAWAKIGCYPYWPSIVTLEYGTSIYVKPGE